MITVNDSPALQRKYFSILRALDVFREELKLWQEHVDDKKYSQILGRNSSQMVRLKLFIDEMLGQAKPYVDKLGPQNGKEDFLLNSDEFTTRFRVIQFVWNYFRGKLDARLTPQFQHSLWTADLIAHDCYKTVMSAVEDRDIPLRATGAEGNSLQITGEAPLPYLEGGMRGVATYRRYSPTPFAGIMFRDGNERNRFLPIAVIELPAEVAQSMWDLIVLAHEVSHDIDGDLNTLHDDLPNALEAALTDVDATRAKNWKGWALETFADLMALRLMGPAYAHYCFQLLVKENVTADATLQYPSSYLRLLLVLMYLREELGYKDEADEIEKNWSFLYGELPEDQKVYFKHDFRIVIDTLLNNPLPALKAPDNDTHTISKLVEFTVKDNEYVNTTRQALIGVVNKLFAQADNSDDVLRDTIRKELGGYVITHITFVEGGGRDVAITESRQPPALRHVASAAYLTFEDLLKDAAEKDLPQCLRLLNLVGQELVKAKQPGIKLAGPVLTQDQREYMTEKARRLFDLFALSVQ
jgi:hypothetical protein